MYLSYNYLERNNNILEGIGSIYQKAISLYAVAKKYNMKYIHKKIPIGIKYENYTDNEWDIIWDKLFNLKSLSDNNVNIDDFDKKYYDVLTYDILNNQILNNKDTIYYIQNPYEISYAEDCYNLIQNEIIKAYDEANNNIQLLYDKNKINIAIHIRVWNDLDHQYEYANYINKCSVRFNYTDDMYINLINKLKIKYPNSNIHIFSQQKYFDLNYSKLKNITDIHFQLEMNAIDTFHHLCKADILVLGLSSFSHLAGFYNNNIVIYLPYSHPPALKNWITEKDLDNL